MRQLSFIRIFVLGLANALIGILLSADAHLPRLHKATSTSYTTRVQRHVVFCPDVGARSNYLVSISANSPNDIWAVGYFDGRDTFYMDGYYDGQTLTDHWDGKKWTPVSSPNPPGDVRISLTGVAAIASDDVWAVGAFQPRAGGVFQTLIEHWDGKVWSIVRSPNTLAGDGDNGDALLAVATISPSNIWAVGASFGPAAPQTLIEHWDGTKWSIVPSPNAPANYADNGQLYAISAASATDIWAVGYYQPGAGIFRALVLHWDGSSWTISPLPNDGLEDFSFLNGVAALSDGEAWAVGDYGSNAPNQAKQVKTLTLHWDGKWWSRVPSPNPGVRNTLRAVAAQSPRDVWAVGNSNDQTTILVHWDGRAWNSAVRPKTRPIQNQLNGIAIASPSKIWAVGYFAAEVRYETLTELYTVSH